MTVQLFQGDCLEVMRGFDEACIDLTVTSPPYDNLRTYKGYSFDFEPIARELYRVTKPGGVVVWVVGDATINGSETGTSFRQALYFKEIGFNLHDTMIWFKSNAMPQVDKSRFTQSFEYMFILSKGKPKASEPRTEKTINGGTYLKRGDGNSQNINKAGGGIVKTERIAFNVRDLPVCEVNYGHPAIFPEALARDHILSWSTEGDTVMDCFMGSGTTGKMAVKYQRNFVGIEIAAEYMDIARARIERVLAQPLLFGY